MLRVIVEISKGYGSAKCLPTVYKATTVLLSFGGIHRAQMELMPVIIKAYFKQKSIFKMLWLVSKTCKFMILTWPKNPMINLNITKPM